MLYYDFCHYQRLLLELSQEINSRHQSKDLIAFPPPPNLLEIFGESDTSSLNNVLGPKLSNCCSCVKSLGVLIDNSFKLERQIEAVPATYDSQLERVMHALITNHLDYIVIPYIMVLISAQSAKYI